MTRPVDRIGIFPAMFGMTRLDAKAKNVCVSCKRDVDDLRANGPWSDGDEAEFAISSLCGDCFEASFDREETA